MDSKSWSETGSYAGVGEDKVGCNAPRVESRALVEEAGGDWFGRLGLRRVG